MNRFLLITTVSPRSFDLESPRHQLFKAFLASLDHIDYDHFEVYIVGDERVKDISERKFLKKIVTDKVTKGERLRVVFNILRSENQRFDYVARLDDDDLISPIIMNNYSTSQADLIADKYHTFYDVVSRKYSQQKRNWIANTAFHKWEHATHILDEDNGSGLCFDYDHAKFWLNYYQNKTISYTNKATPVYIRVLNPLSVTSMSGRIDSSLKKQAYIEYLRGFGDFSRQILFQTFSARINELKRISSSFGFEIEHDFNIGMLSRILNKLKI